MTGRKHKYISVSTVDGRSMDACDVDLFRYKEVYLIVVTGQTPNICGHVLLNWGGHGGYYVHVQNKFQPPLILTESGYQTYVASYGKKEIKRERINLGFPEKSLLFLEKLLSENWNFNILFNNCSHFVEKVLQAGNFPIYIPTHCPVMRGIGTFD